MTDLTLAQYIADVASPTPAPGGGSVSATVGSLGCALGEMAVGISSRRKSGDPDGAFEVARRELESTRESLLHLASEDEQAYLAFRSTQSMPKESDADRDARERAMTTALVHATLVPLTMAESGLAGLAVIERIAPLVSRYVLSDLSTATYALDASIKGALANVETNTAMMSDASDRARFSEQRGALDDKRAAVIETIAAAVASRT